MSAPANWRTMSAGNDLDWLIVRLSGYPKDPGEQSPRFTTDVDLAMALFSNTDKLDLALNWGFYAYPDGAKFKFVVSSWHKKNKHEYFDTVVEYGATAAMAICKAWLACYESGLCEIAEQAVHP